MRTTISIDDELLAKAREYTGVSETPTLVRIALQSLVQREAARRLALLGGSAPDLEAPPRRHLEPMEPE
ncbi:type II toxin-antitoxin system VapB family antitoxin [Rhizobium sp. 18065]|uniref:type II toxin-antitoxin system VapB family antitoxin n=1 Tax=Rhizobium sp. 18065 TaxID=2681411 RepID=UPI0013585C7A|nr:type II toxin-antitoxin system VapB family antitoxin [Rhizobium sp. 18065]